MLAQTSAQQRLDEEVSYLRFPIRPRHPSWRPRVGPHLIVPRPRFKFLSRTTGDKFTIGVRRTALSGEGMIDGAHANYDIASDGAHSRMPKHAGGESQGIVVHNWDR